jgi:hypothetical protein
LEEVSLAIFLVAMHAAKRDACMVSVLVLCGELAGCGRKHQRAFKAARLKEKNDKC